MRLLALLLPCDNKVKVIGGLLVTLLTLVSLYGDSGHGTRLCTATSESPVTMHSSEPQKVRMVLRPPKFRKIGDVLFRRH